MRHELTLRTVQRQVEVARGDKVRRDAAYFTPRVLGEACLVRLSGEDIGSEVCVGAVVNYEANDSHEAAGRCEKIE